MASFESNGGAPRVPLYSQDIMDEVRAFNAGLTPAGNKPRPSRSRGGGGAAARGRSPAVAPNRPSTIVPAPSTTTRSHAPGATRSGNVAGWGRKGPYTVGPTTAAPIFKATNPPKIRSVSPNRSVSGPAIVGRPAAPIRPRSPMRPSILVQEAPAQPMFPSSNISFDSQGQQSNGIFGNQVSQGSGTLGNKGIQNGTFGNHSMFGGQGAPSAQSNTTFGNQDNSFNNPSPLIPSQPVGTLAGQPVHNPGCQPVVTNMAPDDSTKPWIPTPFQQRSAKEALMEIADMLAFEEVTSDGDTLGSHSWDVSHGVNSPAAAKSTPNRNFQASIAPNACMNTAAKKPVVANVIANGSTLYGEVRVPSYEMDIDMVDGIPTTQFGWKEIQDVSRTLSELPKLSESRWATPSLATSSGLNTPTAAGTFGSTNENIKPAAAKPAFSGFDINKSIASELAKGFGAAAHPISIFQPAQNPFLANGFNSMAAANPTVAQPAQNSFATGFDATSISRNIANELARATGLAPAANGFTASQSLSYSTSAFGGPVAGWAQAPAPLQSNPFNPGPSPVSNPLFNATAQTDIPNPTVTLISAAPASKDKVYYLADSRWAR